MRRHVACRTHCAPSRVSARRVHLPFPDRRTPRPRNVVIRGATVLDSQHQSRTLVFHCARSRGRGHLPYRPPAVGQWWDHRDASDHIARATEARGHRLAQLVCSCTSAPNLYRGWHVFLRSPVGVRHGRERPWGVYQRGYPDRPTRLTRHR